MRPPYQLELALPVPSRGEAPRQDAQEVEAVTATAEPESPASTAHLMEAICAPDNIEAALRAVVRNKGAPGVDGITVKRLPSILKARWPEIEEQLLRGRYQPQPVRRVRIPKPAGGTRNLGIPTVIDRVTQQAVLQRLQPRWDPTFSEHSFGFRPGRSAHQAVAQAQACVIDGYRFVVDIDLAKFLDPASDCPHVHEWLSKRSAWAWMSLIRKPFCWSRRTWTAGSSPRLTRCNTVWRETPRLRDASCMVTYRPGKSALDAVGVARQRCYWVPDLDIKSFFDDIDREPLMRAVRKHTDCPWVLLYLERWLRAPVQMADGSLIGRERGTPRVRHVDAAEPFGRPVRALCR
jgi:retron-type reverse transcriptase